MRSLSCRTISFAGAFPRTNAWRETERRYLTRWYGWQIRLRLFLPISEMSEYMWDLHAAKGEKR